MSKFQRDENNLVENAEYKYDPDGRIDWKALLNVKWLRVKDDKKSEVERKYKKPISELDLSTVEDYYLYVTLGGYNEVARLRGFDSLIHKVDFVDQTKAVVTCTMHFLPNHEDKAGLTCSGVASGSVYNVSPDFVQFMETIAENRAFVRCVRRALNINIVGQEELGKGLSMTQGAAESRPEEPQETASLKPYAVLEKRCRELKITFVALQTSAKTIKDKLTSDPASWTDFKDIEKADVWTLLGR